MVAVAGAVIHGTMEDLHERMSIVESICMTLPPDIGENWQAVIDIIKVLKKDGEEGKKENEECKKELKQMQKSEELNKEKIRITENEVASAHAGIKENQRECADIHKLQQ